MAHIVPHGVSDYSDFVIDEIVARCSDDMHGALKALLLINEAPRSGAKPPPQPIGLSNGNGPPDKRFAALTQYQGNVGSLSGFGGTDCRCASTEVSPVALVRGSHFSSAHDPKALGPSF